MNTSKALVDVHEGKLTLRVGDESIDFDMFKAVKNFDVREDDVCIRVDVVDDCLREFVGRRKWESEKKLEELKDDLEKIETLTFEPLPLILKTHPSISYSTTTTRT
ncbi:conserved hypothetical protein [Ricinus communis]|uniref:Uncharacterized protein n=1 Tax=Ricinus communis TaxID=3988 RepID=B9RWW9_RICCO|nr:conserved hypothetical protein [Ricinus communis]